MACETLNANGTVSTVSSPSSQEIRKLYAVRSSNRTKRATTNGDRFKSLPLDTAGHCNPSPTLFKIVGRSTERIQPCDADISVTPREMAGSIANDSARSLQCEPIPSFPQVCQQIELSLAGVETLETLSVQALGMGATEFQRETFLKAMRAINGLDNDDISALRSINIPGTNERGEFTYSTDGVNQLWSPNDGRMETVLPDGTKVINFADKSSSIEKPDGEVSTFRNGVTTIMKLDSSVVERDSHGERVLPNMTIAERLEGLSGLNDPDSILDASVEMPAEEWNAMFAKICRDAHLTRYHVEGALSLEKREPGFVKNGFSPDVVKMFDMLKALPEAQQYQVLVNL